MDSLTFTPGRALLLSVSPVFPNGRWSVVFEDEGPAGYCYACDASLGANEESIADSMLIYNVSALQEPARERLVSIQWSRSGLQAVLYLDGMAQAWIDFEKRQSFCRSNFPNFMEESNATWRTNSHAWDEAAIGAFEADVYQ